MRKDIEWFKKEFDGVIEFRKQSNPSSIWDMVINATLKYIEENFKNLIDQLDEPEVLSQELPVIPKYVAEYLEFVKSDVSLMQVLELASTIREWDERERWNIWISANDETFARAWLDGYTVEEEQKYYVMNEENELILGWSQSAYMTPCIEGYEYMKHNGRENLFQLTEQEIKNYDERYWPFAVPVEVAK